MSSTAFSGVSSGPYTIAEYVWSATGLAVDSSFFVAIVTFEVVGITARVDVAGTDAGAVTAQIRKAPSGTAVASGTLLHTGTINLKGTANTNQTLTLSATPSDLQLAVGDCIGFDLTGVSTAAVGCVTVRLRPTA